MVWLVGSLVKFSPVKIKLEVSQSFGNYKWAIT